MVGVAGKSKACHDCRRRRVKCDFQKPTCLRCEKAGIPCRGYGRATVFVNRTFAAPSTSALSALSEIKRHSAQETAASTPSYLLILRRLKTDISNPSCPPMEFRTHAWALLSDLYLPREHMRNELRVGGASYSWVQAVCDLRGRSDALDHSLLAFCAIQVHIAETGSTSTDTGLQMYNNALQKLVKDIEPGRLTNNEETLASIVVLSTCELFIFANDQGWLAHAQGISEILRHRASDYTSPVCQSLCSRLRIICVILGLTKRRALDLRAETWRKLVHLDHKAESFEGMVDLISEVPLLLEESEAVLSSAEAIISNPEPALLRSLLYAFQRLDTWQDSFRLSFEKSAHWAVPSKMHNPSDDLYPERLFPFALEFESLNGAIALIFTSAVMLQILGTMLLLLNKRIDGLEKHTTGHDLDGSYGPAPPHGQKRTAPTSESIEQMSSLEAKADRLARFLCQSIEYCYRLEMGTIGLQVTGHAQWSLREYFRQARRKRELEWCKTIKYMSAPGSHYGIELMRFGDEESTS